MERELGSRYSAAVASLLPGLVPCSGYAVVCMENGEGSVRGLTWEGWGTLRSDSLVVERAPRVSEEETTAC